MNVLLYIGNCILSAPSEVEGHLNFKKNLLNYGRIPPMHRHYDPCVFSAGACFLATLT